MDDLALRDIYPGHDGRCTGRGASGRQRPLYGGEFGWLSPFAVICGVGLCLGYTLLGACWLVRKGEGELRESAYRLIPYLSIGLFVFLIVVFGYVLAENLASTAAGWNVLFVCFRRSARWPRSYSVAQRPRRRDARPHPTGLADLCCGIWRSPSVLAMHSLHHHRGSCRAAFEPSFHVLGSRPVRIPAHSDLHGD